jgi:tRNA(fMet)-specific endonuclease VapC
MAYLLDTDTCIFIKKKVQAIQQKFGSINPSHLFVSSITVAELEYGVSKSKLAEHNTKRLSNFLSRLTILDFTKQSAKQYGLIRASLEQRGMPIGANDMLIAAIAKSHDLTLVTNNEKEFSRVESLKIENWLKE